MTIEQYQTIVKLDTGSTTYDYDICKILNIKTDRNIQEVKKDIDKQKNIVVSKKYKTKLKINGKWYMADKDLLECTYEQFIELDRILAEENNIENIHRLLGIYFRPRKFNFKKMRWQPAPFDIRDQEQIANEIQKHMGMAEANGLVVFFYHLATKSSKNINIYYLNRTKVESI